MNPLEQLAADLQREDNQLGRYTLERKLAQGGMASLWLGTQQSTGRKVAIKTLPAASDSDATTRFEREAKVLASLTHAHILPLLDYGATEDRQFLVMPYLEHGDLESKLARTLGPLDLSDTRRLLTQLASALDHAHGKGVVHRDIKPANILLDGEGNALLADFGIAHNGGERLTMVGKAIGTPEYMAPEQIDGLPGPRSDLYALGVVAYQALTGQLPFRGKTMADTLNAQRYDLLTPPSSLNPTLPPAVDALLQKALAKDPNQRFANGEAFAQAVRESLPEQPAPQLATQQVTAPDAARSAQPDAALPSASTESVRRRTPPAETTAQVAAEEMRGAAEDQQAATYAYETAPVSLADQQAEVAFQERQEAEHARELQSWFADSTVVDPTGEPLLLYHGTNAPPFDTFDRQQMGEGDGHADWGDGFYFTDTLAAAQKFATEPGNGRVVSVYLHLTNPATNQVMNSPELQDVIDDDMRFVTVEEKLASMGHDGIVITHPGGEREYVVFDPAKIRIVDSTPWPPTPSPQALPAPATRSAALQDRIAALLGVPGLPADVSSRVQSLPPELATIPAAAAHLRQIATDLSRSATSHKDPAAATRDRATASRLLAAADFLQQTAGPSTTPTPNPVVHTVDPAAPFPIDIRSASAAPADANEPFLGNISGGGAPPRPEPHQLAGYTSTLHGEHVHYRRIENGRLSLIDTGKEIRVKDAEAIADALKLAAMKWPAPLKISGTPAFIATVQRHAQQLGIAVSTEPKRRLIAPALASSIAVARALSAPFRLGGRLVAEHFTSPNRQVRAADRSSKALVRDLEAFDATRRRADQVPGYEPYLRDLKAYREPGPARDIAVARATVFLEQSPAARAATEQLLQDAARVVLNASTLVTDAGKLAAATGQGHPMHHAAAQAAIDQALATANQFDGVLLNGSNVAAKLHKLAQDAIEHVQSTLPAYVPDDQPRAAPASPPARPSAQRRSFDELQPE